MGSRFYAVMLVAALVLLSGCVNIGVTQVVERNGSSTFTNSIDFSKLIMAPTSAQMKEACDKMMNETPGLNCTYSGEVLSVTRTVGPDEGKYVFTAESQFPNRVYTLKVDRVVSLGGEQNLNGGEYTDTFGGGDEMELDGAQSASVAQGLSVVDVRMSYTVKMPGEIVQAYDGLITSKDTVTYDVIQLMRDGKAIEVRSQELDVPVVFIVVLAVIAVLGIAIYKLCWCKAKKMKFGMIALFAVMLLGMASADVIVPGEVHVCEKITNADAFEGYEFVLFPTDMYDAYSKVTANECLAFYKFSDPKLYAVKGTVPESGFDHNSENVKQVWMGEIEFETTAEGHGASEIVNEYVLVKNDGTFTLERKLNNDGVCQGTVVLMGCIAGLLVLRVAK